MLKDKYLREIVEKSGRREITSSIVDKAEAESRKVSIRQLQECYCTYDFYKLGEKERYTRNQYYTNIKLALDR